MDRQAELERQRAFERARRGLEALCYLKGWPEPVRARSPAPPTELLERARLPLHALGTARGTPGGRAVADLAARSYAVSRRRIGLPPGAVSDGTPLDAPGFIAYGRMIPTRGALTWRSIELRALKIDIGALPYRRWAHEILEVRRKLALEGLIFEDR